MKVVTLKGNAIDVPPEVGQVFLDSGLVTLYKKFETPAAKLPTIWKVGRVLTTGYPYIDAQCPNQPCASQRLKHIAQGPDAPKEPFFHCGHVGGELCPPDITEKFLNALKTKPQRRPAPALEEL